MNININTKLYGLLGYPLGQSLSPKMQNAAFNECDLNKIYIPIEVLSENLETVVKGMSKMNFEGFNITKPYKIDIMRFLNEIDDYARCIGAVNTVSIKDGKLKGYNTDGIGFLRNFENNTNSNIEGKNVLMLGSGGAARAIGMTLALNKAKKIYICNRTHEKAVSLSNDINNQVGSCSEAIPMEYELIKKVINYSDVLINTTSVGMFPDLESSPIDKMLLNKNLIVCDIVYNPRKTKLIEDAEEVGCRVVLGLGMLVYQGTAAFEIWTGLKAPEELMFSVVDEGLN